jgi:hypothetical protein
MGGSAFREDEEKKKNADGGAPDVVDAAFQPTLPVSMTAEPGLRSTSPGHRESHLQPTQDGRQPDEVEVDWRRYVVPTAPSHPFPVHEVAVANEPDGFHANGTDAFLRRHAWDMFRTATTHVDAKQRAAAGDIDAFFSVSTNPQLQALGFVLSKGGNADTASSANEQMAAQDGVKVGSLFRDEGKLNTTKSDERGLQQAQHAFEKHGAAKGAHDGANVADIALGKHLSDLSAATNKLKGAHAELDQGYEKVMITATRHQIAKALCANVA